MGGGSAARARRWSLRPGQRAAAPVTQLPLLWTPAPHSDEGTSREAAKRIVPHLERLEGIVLDCLRHSPGLCAFELELRTGFSGNTVRPRLVALRARGLVEKTTETRTTPSGRSAAVWRAKDATPRC